MPNVLNCPFVLAPHVTILSIRSQKSFFSFSTVKSHMVIPANFGATFGKHTNWTISQSKIDGVGVFATRWLTPGELIGMAIENTLGFIPTITFFGSKVNHSYKANTVLRYDYSTKTHNLYAIGCIAPGTELTADYRYTPMYIMGPQPHFR